MVVGDSENTRWLLSFILDKITFNISVWHNEEKLTHCTVKTLYKLTRRNKTRSAKTMDTCTYTRVLLWKNIPI